MLVPSDLDTYLFPLVADGACPAGTFELEFESGRMSWTDGLYGICGFTRGQIVPTFDVLLTHLHPDDREPFETLLRKLSERGGQVALLHRVIDSRGRQRQVFSSVQAKAGPTDTAQQATGFMVDLTRSMREESRQRAEEAVQGALAHTAAIEQAKGIVMSVLLVGPEVAFKVLADRSQRTNTKLHTVAASLVDAIRTGRAADLVNAWAGAMSKPARS